MRLAILTTHPIQYYAPVFALLAKVSGLEVRVFYGWKGLVEGGHDRDFGQAIKWDIPLLEGYDSQFVDNKSSDPGTHHFKGIDLPTLNENVSAWGAEALLVYGWSFKSHLKALRYFHGKIPVFFRGDSTLLNERTGGRRILRRIFLRWVYRYVDTAFYVGSQNRKYYRALGLGKEKLIFAPHSIDHHHFSDLSGVHEKNALTWRHQLGISDSAVVFLQVGKLDENKAPLEVLSAFQKLSHHEDVHMVFVGSGELECKLKKLSDERVHFLGFQNQSVMPTVYRIGDLLIMASYSETWGLAINEAMACGRAVAASHQVGCAVDLIEQERNGWHFPETDPSALESVLRQAAESGREGLRTMGAESRVIIDDWSLQRQADCISKRVLGLTSS